MEKNQEPFREVDSNTDRMDKNEEKSSKGEETARASNPPPLLTIDYVDENEENMPINVLDGIPSQRKTETHRYSLLKSFDPLFERSLRDDVVEESIEKKEAPVSGPSEDINSSGVVDKLIDITIAENPVVEDTSSVLKDISNIVQNIIERVSDITEITAEESEREISFSEQEKENCFNSPTETENTVIFQSPDKKDKMSELIPNDDTESLRLKLNASQQMVATLELQLRQKEEIIIKLESEATRKEQAFKTEVTALKETFEAKEKEYNSNDVMKDMEEQIKQLKKREVKLMSDLKKFPEVLSEWDKTYSEHVKEQKKLVEKHEIAKQHLASLEMSFSDLLQKYERAKTIIAGFKSNEEILQKHCAELEDIIKKNVEKYESLKAHAKAQIEKFNKDYVLMCEKYEAENAKLTTLIKRLEIKNASLVNSLQQKTEECSALAALCDEVTGKV